MKYFLLISLIILEEFLELMHHVWPRMAHYNPYIIFDKIVLKERGGLEIFNAKLQTFMDI